MEHFLGGIPPSGTVEDGIAWGETNAYVEAKVMVDSQWFPVYVLTVAEGVGAAATCWDHQFDAILDNLSTPGVAPVARRLQPTWFACADNALRERYGDGAVLELIDPDVMNRKWMIAVLFSHHAEDRHAVAGAAVDRVLKISAKIARESANKPSTFDYVRAAAVGAFHGGVKGMAMAEKIRSAAHWIPGFPS